MTAGGFDVDANTWPYPPVASTTARRGHHADGLDVAAGVDPGDGHAGRLRAPVGGRCRCTRSRANARSSTSTPAASADSSSVRWTSAPLRSPPAWTMRLWLWPPSRVERRAVAAGLRVERRAQAHQVADRRRRLGDQLAHDGLVAQPGPGGQRVADVVLERVGGVEHAGQPALGPRRRAGVEDVLGDDEHAAHRAHGERGGQPGGARAEHDDVDVTRPRRRRRGQPGRDAGHVTRRRRRLPMAIIRSTDRRARSAMSGGTSTTSVPSRSERSSLAGVIIFMYLHTAARLTGSNSTSGLAFVSWLSIPVSVATSTLRAVVSRPR